MSTVLLFFSWWFWSWGKDHQLKIMFNANPANYILDQFIILSIKDPKIDKMPD